MEFWIINLIHISMKHSILIKPDPLKGDDKIEELHQSLELIDHKLDMEILAKQKTIERQEQEIQRLHLELERNDKTILHTGEKLSECISKSEGNRQLINKLLNDIERLQQDIDWYKRTYEKRSFLGTLKEKIFFKK